MVVLTPDTSFIEFIEWVCDERTSYKQRFMSKKANINCTPSVESQLID